MANRSYNELIKLAYKLTTHRRGLAKKFSLFCEKRLELSYKKWEGTGSKKACLEIGGGKFPHILHNLSDNWKKVGIDVYPEGSPGGGKLLRVTGNASSLPFSNNSFDRIVAIHSLEHILNLEQTCKEFKSVLKMGGILSAILPCDPGILWSIAQLFSRHQVGMSREEYDYFMANQHVNPVYNVLAILNFHFVQKHLVYYPITILPFRHLGFAIIGHWQKP
jgi:phosphatidylethanolamine/phosphatidyl-N-methylethanolamine N-methyltransferase